MPKTLSKILLILFLSLSIFGCKNSYKVKDYLSDLATITGFNEETYLDDLRSYGIIDNQVLRATRLLALINSRIINLIKNA